MNLSVTFRLTGTGWAECHLKDEHSECTVTASYLSDALRNLVLAATAVVSGFRNVTFSFDEEPGEFRWVISTPRLNEIELQILEFRELWNERPDSAGILRFRTRCLPGIFAEAVHRAAGDVLSAIGERGYAEKWAEHPFPLAQLQELGRLLEVSAVPRVSPS